MQPYVPGVSLVKITIETFCSLNKQVGLNAKVFAY